MPNGWAYPLVGRHPECFVHRDGQISVDRGQRDTVQPSGGHQQLSDGGTQPGGGKTLSDPGGELAHR